MKIVLISLLLVTQFSIAQSFKCRLGGNLDLHLKQQETQGQYSPFQSQVEYPSIASFFDNAIGFNLDASFRFGNTSIVKGQIFIGINYERCGISSSSNDAKYVLGETILKNKITPYLGFGMYVDPNEYYTFLYGFGGFVIKSYSGEGKLPGTLDGNPITLDADYNYSNSLSLRLGGGIDFENIKDSPITIGLQAALEVGKINREPVDIFYNNEKIGEGTVEGEKSLYDNTIILSLSIGYQINWETDAE
jgi:hypothetical protein